MLIYSCDTKNTLCSIKKERAMIPNNLKFYRQQKRGLTQARLATAVGITEQHCQNIEYGKAKPNVYLAQRLAKALGKEVHDIFPIEEDGKEKSSGC